MTHITRRLGAVLAATATIGTMAMATAQPAHAADNTQAVYNFFVTKGLTPVQAAGITGNFMQESGASISPTTVQQHGGPGRGIAQWETRHRWDTDANDNMVSFAGAHGWDRWGLQPQLEFTWYELTTRSWYGLSTLRKQTTIEGATLAFSKNFEGCGTCENNTRIAYAKTVYSRYNGATPPTGEVTTGLPLLKQGSSGQAVKTVQYLLGINADGLYGSGTASAVSAYQRSHGLSSDGVVGGNTWNALLVTLRSGDSGAAVKALQADLNAAGASLAVDGAFGPGTTTAVRNYQAAHGLSVDGVVGDNTWTSLITH